GLVGRKRLATPRGEPLRKAWRSSGSPTPDTAVWGHSPDVPVWRYGDHQSGRGGPQKPLLAPSDSFNLPPAQRPVETPYSLAAPIPAWQSFLNKALFPTMAGSF